MLDGWFLVIRDYSHRIMTSGSGHTECSVLVSVTANAHRLGSEGVRFEVFTIERQTPYRAHGISIEDLLNHNIVLICHILHREGLREHLIRGQQTERQIAEADGNSGGFAHAVTDSHFSNDLARILVPITDRERCSANLSPLQ